MMIPDLQAAVFDLDGTLLDTLDDLADCINETLTRFGYPSHPVDAYRLMVGTGARRLVEIAAGRDADPSSVSEGKVDRMLDHFSGLYSARWHCKTKPYDGVCTMLDTLSEAGIVLAVLSNKADPFTRDMVRWFFPHVPFASVIGQRPGVPVKPDPASALETAHRIGCDPGRTAYIGDSGSDMTTALRAGMVPVGVLWGFRDRTELQDAGAGLLVSRPSELAACFAAMQ